MNDIDVMIRVAADAADGARGLDGIGSAAREMADDIERAAEEAERSLGGIADAADGVASNASILAGAFGDIGGGLEAVGLGGFTDELEGASTALMFAAGVSDTLSVATNVLSLSKIKDTAATVANKAASLASSAATKAQAAAQWALNAAMAANPIGLIIVAVIALVALFVVLYKRSDRFRSIVQAVGRAGRAALGWIVDRAKDLVGWVRDKVPAAWNKFREVAVNALRLVTTPQRAMLRLVTNIGGWLKDKIPGAMEAFKTKVKEAFDAVTTPIRTVRDLIKSVIDWIAKIDLGPIDDIAGALKGGAGKVGDVLGGLVGRTVVPNSTTTAAPSTVVNIPIKVYGALDPDATARKIETVVGARVRRLGGVGTGRILPA